MTTRSQYPHSTPSPCRWTSFAAGASTSLYVYLYSVYYFLFKTKMYGLFQTVFYFGYMGLFSAALGEYGIRFIVERLLEGGVIRWTVG